MIRLSMLKNYPVIQKNRKIGLLQSVCLDDSQKQVSAFIVSCGFQGKRWVPAQSVCAVADEFILIDQSERFKRQKHAEAYPFVRDTSGLLVGCVVDYAIDEDTLSVCAAEMLPGYLPSDWRRKQWIYEYSSAGSPSGDLVIPAGICKEPYLTDGRKEECGFRQ